jgi:hypothetical protein
LISTSPRRHKLGAWAFPSDNHVAVYLEPGAGRARSALVLIP